MRNSIPRTILRLRSASPVIQPGVQPGFHSVTQNNPTACRAEVGCDFNAGKENGQKVRSQFLRIGF